MYNILGPSKGLYVGNLDGLYSSVGTLVGSEDGIGEGEYSDNCDETAAIVASSNRAFILGRLGTYFLSSQMRIWETTQLNSGKGNSNCLEV